MASYSSSVDYSFTYNSSSSFTVTVTGSAHSSKRYYFFCVTWWDGESDVIIYSYNNYLAGGVTSKAFTVSNSYVKANETYTIHWMWGTSAGTTTNLDNLSDYSYYNTKGYEHKSGTTTYTITYKGNGGSPSRDNDTGAYGKVISLPNATMSSESEPAYRYYITFDANDGSVSPAGSYTQCTATTSYSLKGWYSAASSGTKYGTYNSSYTITANKTMYAQWNSSTTYTDSKLASLPTPTRSGYTFDGWYTAKSGGTKITTSTVFTEASTIYAHWSRSTYTVKMYYLYGSTIISSTGTSTVNVGSTFYVNDHKKTITGYNFSSVVPANNFTVNSDTEVNYYYTPYSETPTVNVYSATYYSLSINVSVSSQPYARTVEITCAGTTISKNISENSTLSETATFGSTTSPLSMGSGYTVTAVVKYNGVEQGRRSKVCYTNFNFTGFNFVAGNPITYLTYTDWNTFRTYLSGKCSRYGISYTPSMVSSGGTLYATDYNNVIQAFKDIGYSQIEVTVPKVSRGDNVRAYPFRVLKNNLNSNDN